MTEAVLLLGANLGDPPSVFRQVARELDRTDICILSLSAVYCSPAWGFEGDDFHNQAILISTSLDPSSLLEQLLNIEQKFGRVRNENGAYNSRPIDIDILVFGSEVIVKDRLQIPHPRMHLRRFALLPLLEVMPGYVFPDGRSVEQLIADCTDTAHVFPLNPNPGE
ncbi:MAG: 2-amino-4-hydroxy-6-hydroxymethyldihydropteridine diphosphokinase [Flavobacteriales bacterium]